MTELRGSMRALKASPWKLNLTLQLARLQIAVLTLDLHVSKHFHDASHRPLRQRLSAVSRHSRNSFSSSPSFDSRSSRQTRQMQNNNRNFSSCRLCLEENKFFPVSTFPGDVYRAPNRSVCSFPIHCRSSFVFVFLWLALEVEIEAGECEEVRKSQERRWKMDLRRRGVRSGCEASKLLRHPRQLHRLPCFRY